MCAEKNVKIKDISALDVNHANLSAEVCMLKTSASEGPGRVA